MADRTSGPQGPGGSGGPTPPRRGFFTRNPLLLAILAVLALLAISNWLNTHNQEELTFSQFAEIVERLPAKPSAGPDGSPPASMPTAEVLKRFGKDPLLINPQTITGKLLPDSEIRRSRVKATADSKGMIEFRVEKGSIKDEEIYKLLSSRGVQYKFDKQSDWGTYLIIALPILLFLAFFMMMFRSSRMTGENVLSFGRSRAKIVGEDKTGVTFEDVAGADEAKEELREIVEFLKEPDRFTALGGKIPRGVLLVGAPGCGKTLLARAVAGEAGVPFFSISGSDFVEMFVGVGAARVRDLFNTAKQKAPCIIFVDEIDAVGRHRGAGLGGGHDEREQTLNQLLVEMDGFDPRKGVIIIAATNRPDILDPALLRPGRFDRHVVLDSPDVRGREAILAIHGKNKPLAPDVDLADVARRTPGFTGADLANVMNEAALLAARRRRENISRREVEEAVERVVAGPERRSRVIGPAEKKILAFHELGHALVARFTPEADPVAKVSIIPRGKGALGYTLTLPTEDRYIITKDQLLARIRVALGGRSAEELVFGHQSTGAEDDLQKVTQLSRALVCRFGMTDSLGPVTYDRSPESPFLGREPMAREVVSERTADLIDVEVRRIVDECHKEARSILQQHRDVLDALAAKLIEVETLSSEDFEHAIKEATARREAAGTYSGR
jgi:cell division protease FtsH